MVLCLLLLMFQAVNWSHTAQIRLTVEEAFSTKRLLLMILRKAGEETEEGEATINELESKYVKLTPLYYINLAGASVMYLIIVWKLITTLFS